VVIHYLKTTKNFNGCFYLHPFLQNEIPRQCSRSYNLTRVLNANTGLRTIIADCYILRVNYFHCDLCCICDSYESFVFLYRGAQRIWFETPRHGFTMRQAGRSLTIVPSCHCYSFFSAANVEHIHDGCHYFCCNTGHVTQEKVGRNFLLLL
jgi:hypothetical protein